MKRTVMSLVAAASLAACSASVSFGNDDLYVEPLAENGEDYVLVWDTTDVDGNVVRTKLFTTSPFYDGVAHYYAPENAGITADAALDCGFDAETDILVDATITYESITATNVTGVDVALGLLGDLEEIPATVVIPVTGDCIAIPNDNGVFYVEGIDNTTTGQPLVVHFYFMFEGLKTIDNPEEFIEGFTFRPGVWEKSAKEIESVTDGRLHLTGEYESE